MFLFHDRHNLKVVTKKYKKIDEGKIIYRNNLLRTKVKTFFVEDFWAFWTLKMYLDHSKYLLFQKMLIVLRSIFIAESWCIKFQLP